MKLRHILCCLAPGGTSADSDDNWSGSAARDVAAHGRAAANQKADLGTAADSTITVTQAACSEQLGAGAGAHAHPDSREACSATVATGQPAPSGRTPKPQERTTNAIEPTIQENNIKNNANNIKNNANPGGQTPPDRLSVARQGFEQLVMDLRFRPGEELPLATFCCPASAATAATTTTTFFAAAAGPSAFHAARLSRPATEPKGLSLPRRLGDPPIHGSAPSSAAAAAVAARPAADAGERVAHAHSQPRHGLSRHSRQGKSGDGSACGAAAGAATVAAGGLGSGGANLRSAGTAGAAVSRRHVTLGTSGVSAAVAWMLQPSLRAALKGGCGSPLGSSAAPSSPAAAAAAATAAAAGCAASSFGSSVSLSFPLPVPATAPPAPLPAAGVGASAAASEAGGAAELEPSRWAVLRGSSSGSSTSPTFGCRAPGPRAIATMTQIGGGDVGRVHDGPRDGRAAAAALPPVAPAEGGGQDGAVAGFRSADQRRRLSGASAGRAATAATPAAAAVAAAATRAPPMTPAVGCGAAAAVIGTAPAAAARLAAAGLGATETDISLGSTVSVSFAGPGVAYWVATGSIEPAFVGSNDVRISDLEFTRTRPVPAAANLAAAAPTPTVAGAAACGGSSAAAAVAASTAVAAATATSETIGGGAGAGAVDSDNDTATSETAASLSNALRRSASVPVIVMERQVELTMGTLGASARENRGRADATGVDAAGISGAAGGGVARGLLAANRPASYLLRCPSPRQPQQPAAGWRTPLVVLPATRRCSLSPAVQAAGGGAGGAGSAAGSAASGGAAASGGGAAWRPYRRSHNLSGKHRSVAVRCGPGSIAGGGVSGGGVWVSNGAGGLAAGGDGGSGPRSKGSSASVSTGSVGRVRQLPPPPGAGPMATVGTASTATLLEYGKVSWPADTLAEAHGLVTVPMGQRHLPYASKYVSQMALLPFLQQQSNSTALQPGPCSAPASLNLAALSKDVTGLRWIGQGGGGAVFQGMWQGVPVAVKFLLTEADGRVDAAALEGVVSTVVNHPNLLHTYAFECTRLTEASFVDGEAPAGSAEEGGTELLESLMESYTNISDSINAIRKSRFLQGLIAGAGGATGGAAGTGGGIGAFSITRRLSRLGVPSLGDLPPLSSSQPQPVLVVATTATSGAACSSEWASAGVPAAAAAAAEGQDRGPEHIHPGTSRERTVQLGSPPPAVVVVGCGGGGGGGGRSGAGAVSRSLQSWFVDMLVPPGLGGHGPALAGRSPPSLLSPPCSPAVAAAAATTPPARSPPSNQQRDAAAVGAGDMADVDLIIAAAGDAVGGCGGGGAAAAAGSPLARAMSSGLHGGGVASATWGRTAKQMQATGFQSEDGFGDPETGLGSQCWSVRQVLSYLKARPGMYMTHIIMEYCDRGSLLSAIKRGIFRTDSVWPDEDGSTGIFGNGRATTAAANAAAAALHSPPATDAAATGGGGGRFLAPPLSSPGASASRRLVFRALLRTARDVAQGMCHLHANGIIHGDLKPGNVLLRGCRSDRRGFTALVSDFGLSKVTRGDKPLELNHWSTVTVMAPEVIMGRWLKASDVFSFGILLWQLVTGEIKPYGKCTVPQILMGVSQGTLKPEWPPAAHPALIRLGRACLANNPEKRPRFDAIVKMLTKIEKDVRSQLLQLQSPTGGPRKAQPQQQQPAPAATAAAAATATHRVPGASPAHGHSAAAAIGAAGGNSGPAASRFVYTGGAAGFVIGCGSSSGPRVGATDWSCTAGSLTFKRAAGTSAGSTGGSGFGVVGGGGCGGVECGAASGHTATGISGGGGDGGNVGSEGAFAGSAPHTARQLRFL